MLFPYNQSLEAIGLIKTFCKASIDSKMVLAGTKPPKGMKEFTCQCFAKKFNEGYSINSAKSICREKAIKEFNL